MKLQKNNVENYKNNKLKIILKGINNVTDMSFMFDGCKSLLSLPDISKWDTNKVINMSRMFNKCSSLSSLPNISKWNTNNVTDMSYMLYGCSNTIFSKVTKTKFNKAIKKIKFQFSY